ncbi:MAG TPA: hypothetical protein VK279_06540 [Solirubrobacteraceae bacterium]|nr:hypothetical protein [Solirubrobacteraceae bacterium]
MSVAAAPLPRRLRARGDALAGRVGLDAVELGCLLVLCVTANVILIALLTKGRPLSGADGLLAADQLQYFTWIREASEHGLIGNRFDLARGDRVFLHPGFLVTGAFHKLTGLSIPASYLLLWKPTAIGLTFYGCLRYVRRLLPAGGRRHVGLVLALFAIAPASFIVAWTGAGGKLWQYRFDFISGEMWSGQYLWGYLMTGVAVFTMPLVLLALERWRASRRPRTLAAATLGALLVGWLQPWQGATLALIVVGVEGWRWWRSGQRPAPALAAVLLAIAVPAGYYFFLSHFDAAWERAGEANQAGAQREWSWPWWAVVLTLLPLAAPAALAYRRSVATPDWQSVAVRVWPLAALAVYVLPLGTFPYHAFQGLTLPLAILAVQGATSVWPRPPLAAVLAALLVMTVPGFIHKIEAASGAVKRAGDPFFVFPDEVRALDALERDPRPGGVLGPTYAGYMIPYRTGRESYIGQFSWTPDWDRRQKIADGLFEGPMRAAEARRVVPRTNARFLFGDCRPGVRDLEPILRPLLERVQRFGCATVYTLRERPGMARAAGRPDE